MIFYIELTQRLRHFQMVSIYKRQFQDALNQFPFVMILLIEREPLWVNRVDCFQVTLRMCCALWSVIVFLCCMLSKAVVGWWMEKEKNWVESNLSTYLHAPLKIRPHLMSLFCLRQGMIVVTMTAEKKRFKIKF